MRRTEVLRKIAREAKRQGASWVLVCEGRSHSVYRLNGAMIPIGHHRELDEMLARKIFVECESELGKDRWR